MEELCRIMIVDDEFIMRQGIRYMMDWEKEGYQVTAEASNGREALDLLKEADPHVILCDIAMPVMDGLDFIRIVKQEHPEIQIVVLSSYDRFDYVRQALLNGATDYVLKPTLNPEELLKVVEKAASAIVGLKIRRKKEVGLEGQLERFFSGQEEALDLWKFQKELPGSCFRLLALPLCRQNLRGADLSQVLYEKAIYLLEQQNHAGFLKFLWNQEILCVIFNYGLKDEEKLLDFLQRFMEQLSILSERAFAVVSGRRKKLEDLKEDFSAPGFLEEDIFYHQGKSLYFREEVQKTESLEKFDFRRFVGLLWEHKYQESLDMFERYMEDAVHVRLPEFKLKNQAKNLLYNLVSSCNQQEAELEKVRKEYFDKIQQASYCGEFLEVVKELTEQMQRLLIQKEDKDGYIREILDYILVHYQEELDLQSLAETFNFNYSYLSAYFNSQMGEGFSEYLNRVRIEKACEYLEDQEYSISQISAMTGYSDHSYFCRVFKKITGRTPSAFRRERRKKL